MSSLSHIFISDAKDQPKSLVSDSEGAAEKAATEAATEAPSEDQSESSKSPKRKNDECTTKKVSAYAVPDNS